MRIEFSDFVLNSDPFENQPEVKESYQSDFFETHDEPVEKENSDRKKSADVIRSNSENLFDDSDFE